MDVRGKLVELLSRYFNIGDSYAYNLTRVKSAFACGTVGLDDFEEFDDEMIEDIASYLIDNGVTVQEWVSVKDRLPEENEYVMIWCGECQIARIEKGISEEQRNAMKRGELDDPCETGWTLSSGYFTLKRSQSYKACDEQGNNLVPYCWYANGGPMKWFGQEVTHWAYLPAPPKGE